MYSKRSTVLRGEEKLLREELRLTSDVYVEYYPQVEEDLIVTEDEEPISSEAIRKAKEDLDNLVTINYNRLNEDDHDQKIT